MFVGLCGIAHINNLVQRFDIDPNGYIVFTVTDRLLPLNGLLYFIIFLPIFIIIKLLIKYLIVMFKYFLKIIFKKENNDKMK